MSPVSTYPSSAAALSRRRPTASPRARSPQRGTGLTTEPNELTASINNERMPVLLTNPADFETWLSGSTDSYKAPDGQ